MPPVAVILLLSALEQRARVAALRAWRALGSLPGDTELILVGAHANAARAALPTQDAPRIKPVGLEGNIAPSVALHEAIVASTGSLLLMVPAGSLLDGPTLAWHFKHARPGRFSSDPGLQLPPMVQRQGDMAHIAFDPPAADVRQRRRRLQDLGRALAPHRLLRSIPAPSALEWPALWCWRQDVIALNGFAPHLHTYEDAADDLARRLERAGLTWQRPASINAMWRDPLAPEAARTTPPAARLAGVAPTAKGLLRPIAGLAAREAAELRMSLPGQPVPAPHKLLLSRGDTVQASPEVRVWLVGFGRPARGWSEPAELRVAVLLPGLDAARALRDLRGCPRLDLLVTAQPVATDLAGLFDEVITVPADALPPADPRQTAEAYVEKAAEPLRRMMHQVLA